MQGGKDAQCWVLRPRKVDDTIADAIVLMQFLREDSSFYLTTKAPFAFSTSFQISILAAAY